MKEINNLNPEKASLVTDVPVKALKLNCDFLRNILIFNLIR